MRTLQKAATCIAVLLLSFSIYSCGDDDDDAIGSVNELIGIWEGVSEDEWVVENGERDETTGEDISNERYELKADMMRKNLTYGKSSKFRVQQWYGSIIAKNPDLSYTPNKLYVKSIK